MNKKMFLITALIGLILVGGAGFGFYTMKMNAKSFKGTALPVKGLNDDNIEKWVEEFKITLEDEAILKSIVDDTEYAARLDVPNGDAVEHLKNAIRVRYVKRDDQIHIGLVGKRKQNEILIEIASTMFEKSKYVVASKDLTFEEYLKMLEEARAKALENG